jgi:hypothetical protein
MSWPRPSVSDCAHQQRTRVQPSVDGHRDLAAEGSRLCKFEMMGVTRGALTTRAEGARPLTSCCNPD